MIYELSYTKKYKKALKRLVRSGFDLSPLKEVVLKLQNGERLDPKYRDHDLQGDFDGFRECHIAFDWVLVYYYEDDILVLTLYDTGTHAQVLGL